jgi:hypothetical protein
VSEKGSTLGRGPSLSCERAQRSEGRLILASIRNLNALPTEELASIRTGPKRWEGRTGRREEQPLPKIAAPREAQHQGVNRNERGPESRNQQSAQLWREGVQQDVRDRRPLRGPITAQPQTVIAERRQGTLVRGV